MKRWTDSALFTVAVVSTWIAALCLMLLLARLAHADDALVLPVDDTGTCALTGRIEPGETIAAFCSLGRAEAEPVFAAIETGSLSVTGHVVRADKGTALVSLTNFGTASASLALARIHLLRGVPATPLARPPTFRDRCLWIALAHGDESASCDLSTPHPGPPGLVVTFPGD